MSPVLKEILAALADEIRLKTFTIRDRLARHHEQIAVAVAAADIIILGKTLLAVAQTLREHRDTFNHVAESLPRLLKLFDPDIYIRIGNDPVLAKELSNLFSQIMATHPNMSENPPPIHVLDDADLARIEQIHLAGCQDPTCEVTMSIAAEKARRAQR